LHAAILTGMLAALVACGPTSGVPERPNLGISNGTAMTVTLFVNGESVATFPAGAGESRLNVSELPGLPWVVEARTSSGRVLASMEIQPGGVRTTVTRDVTTMIGQMDRVDLSCGRLTIWAGDQQPSGPAPDPSAGEPGDCVP